MYRMMLVAAHLHAAVAWVTGCCFATYGGKLGGYMDPCDKLENRQNPLADFEGEACTKRDLMLSARKRADEKCGLSIYEEEDIFIRENEKQFGEENVLKYFSPRDAAKSGAAAEAEVKFFKWFLELTKIKERFETKKKGADEILCQKGRGLCIADDKCPQTEEEKKQLEEKKRLEEENWAARATGCCWVDDKNDVALCKEYKDRKKTDLTYLPGRKCQRSELLKFATERVDKRCGWNLYSDMGRDARNGLYLSYFTKDVIIKYFTPPDSEADAKAEEEFSKWFLGLEINQHRVKTSYEEKIDPDDFYAEACTPDNYDLCIIGFEQLDMPNTKKRKCEEEKNKGPAAPDPETKPEAKKKQKEAAKAVGSDPPKIGTVDSNPKSAAAEQEDQVAATRRLDCNKSPLGHGEKEISHERFDKACKCLNGYPATKDPQDWDAMATLKKFAVGKGDERLTLDYEHLEGFPKTYEGIKKCAEESGEELKKQEELNKQDEKNKVPAAPAPEESKKHEESNKQDRWAACCYDADAKDGALLTARNPGYISGYEHCADGLLDVDIHGGGGEKENAEKCAGLNEGERGEKLNTPPDELTKLINAAYQKTYWGRGKSKISKTEYEKAFKEELEKQEELAKKDKQKLGGEFKCCIRFDIYTGQVAMNAQTPTCESPYKEMPIAPEQGQFSCSMEFLTQYIEAQGMSGMTATELIKTAYNTPAAEGTPDVNEAIENVEDTGYSHARSVGPQSTRAKKVFHHKLRGKPKVAKPAAAKVTKPFIIAKKIKNSVSKLSKKVKRMMFGREEV